MLLTPEIATAELLAVAVAADLFETEMAAGEVWRYVCTVASWIKQGEDDVEASAATGSMYVGPNEVVYLEPGFEQGGFLSAIRAAGDGSASLTRMRYRPDPAITT